jgi:hypothetical protein
LCLFFWGSLTNHEVESIQVDCKYRKANNEFERASNNMKLPLYLFHPFRQKKRKMTMKRRKRKKMTMNRKRRKKEEKSRRKAKQ